MPGNALKKYNEKRDFEITSEPQGRSARSKSKNLMFTVQKHDATRLHYDFRLEWSGVLWSWAVPKGPSYYPKDKRLAVRTEDHPVSYGDFEGIIPENQYGAGPVMLWDTGRWKPLDEDPAKALEKGKLRFLLEGEKLQGEWVLARMQAKDKSRENWLLIKAKDEKAADKEDKSFLKNTDYSVKTGRDFEEIAANVNTKKTRKTKKSRAGKKQSGEDFQKLEKTYRAPQLATLVESPPESKNWVHEIKYDGYRILVFFSDGAVRIRTRNGHNWTDKFPVLKEAFENLETGSFVIDGEAVVINENGLSDFKALQNGLGVTDIAMQGYFFDLLHWNGEDYQNKPFSARRRALEKLFKEIPEGPLMLSEIIEGKAVRVIDKACDLGLEGIISKNADAKYVQKRARSWVKSKCEKRQEFIICGFVPASDIPRAIGSLHLGYYKNNNLVYAGKVGTGFNQKIARDLYKRLEKLERKTPPFDQKPDGRHKGTLWTTPELLCEVKFAMWTQSGKIRHASYQGLREDKAPKEIVREEAGRMKERQAAKRSKAKQGQDCSVRGVRISNPDREIFPAAHITKSELAAFYSEMADWIMPSIENRPVSLVRCPGGIDKECFFQRSKGKGMPDHIHVIDIRHDGKKHDYIYLKNITGLIELVQMGGIEIHPWGVLIDKTEKPDRIIFDLDPDEGIPFEAIKLAAQDVKSRLDDLGLESFLKCTGGKGLHVTVPVQRRHDWDTVKNFARNFAGAMVRDVPDAYTINMAKKKRKGKIFIDYLRNDFSSTAVMDYCVRARTGAPVAVPLAWKEMEKLDSASQFSLKEVLERKKNKELFSYPDIRQSLTRDILESFQ